MAMKKTGARVATNPTATTRARAGTAKRATTFGAAVIGLLASAVPVEAHTQTGALGNGAEATDYYQVFCSDDGTGAPGSLSVQISDQAPAAAPLVSVQVRNGPDLATSTDPTDADGAASPLIHVNVRAGSVFDVLVDKTGAGSENYVLTFHCVTGPDGTGLHTGTDIVTRQNQ
ncbi:MAG: hypothetical protein IPK00_16195 [Deltaproteobacteria bacterium]|nr:hypothetical protein [Deltaproteobacteria bacterium]